MTTITIEQVRQVVREELAAWEKRNGKSVLTIDLPPGVGKLALETRRCKAPGRGGTQCTRMTGHRERHRYGPPPEGAAPDQRGWYGVTAYRHQQKSRTYDVRLGNPVKIKGEGKHRADGTRSDSSGWTVVGIEKHADGRVNVEVKKSRDGHTRVFPADKIIYQRPRKGSS